MNEDRFLQFEQFLPFGRFGVTSADKDGVKRREEGNMWDHLLEILALHFQFPVLAGRRCSDGRGHLDDS